MSKRRLGSINPKKNGLRQLINIVIVRFVFAKPKIFCKKKKMTFDNYYNGNSHAIRGSDMRFFSGVC